MIKERIRLYQAIKKGDYELAHSWRAKTYECPLTTYQSVFRVDGGSRFHSFGGEFCQRPELHAQYLMSQNSRVIPMDREIVRTGRLVAHSKLKTRFEATQRLKRSSLELPTEFLARFLLYLEPATLKFSINNLNEKRESYKAR